MCFVLTGVLDGPKRTKSYIKTVRETDSYRYYISLVKHTTYSTWVIRAKSIFLCKKWGEAKRYILRL